jgi:hypothetical protein
MAKENPRIGLIGPSLPDEPALPRAFELLLRDAAVRQVIYLGADDSPHTLVAEWTRQGLGEQEFLRNGVELACSGTPEQIGALLSEERSVNRLQRIRVLPPPPARAVEMLDRFLVLAVHDKAVLDEDDIANAHVIVYGRADEPNWKRFGPRGFFTPGPLARGFIGCLELMQEGHIEVRLLDLDGVVRMREPLQSGPGKLVVTP